MIDRLKKDPDTPLRIPNGNPSALCNRLRRRNLPHRTMRIGTDVWVLTPSRYEIATKAAQDAALASLTAMANRMTK